MRLLAMTVLGALAAAGAGSYHVAGKIPIGGEGGWDYLTMDSAGRRLYVSHGTRVVVVDPDARKVVGEIADTPGVHGIAVARRLNRGFTSNGRGNNVTVFDLKTLKTIGTVSTGQNPDSILFDAASGRVFTFNGRSGDATAINAKTAKVEGTIPLGGKPEFCVSDGKGTVFVNIEDKHEMAVIDSRKLAVTKRYDLTGCEEPSGLALDEAHRRLFSVCRNKVMAISDPDAGRVVATVPIGQGPDGAGFDAGAGLAFSSNGDGTLTVVRGTGDKYEVVENAATQRGARTMAVDTKTHRVYLPTAEFEGTPAAGRRPAIVPNTFTVLVVEP